MEYSYKNSPSENVKKLVLGEDSLNMYFDGALYQYPYKEIIGVWLDKPGGLFDQRFFSCTLNISDQKPLFISSRNYDEASDPINQDNHYNSFVRVMHLHLKEKSKARYHLGVAPFSYAVRIMIMVLVLAECIISFTHFEISGYLLIIPSALGLLIAFSALRFGISKFPKLYKPDNIPLDLLPG